MAIFKFQKDPNPPSLGLVNKYLESTLQDIPKKRTKPKSFVFYTVVTFFICLYINQILVLIVFRDRADLATALLYSAYHMSPIKLSTFIIWRSKWMKLIDYTTRVEEELSSDEKCLHLMKKYTKYARIICISFWSMSTLTNITFFLKIFYLKYLEAEYGITNGNTNIFHIWWPWNLGKGWIYTDMMIQILYGLIAVTYVVGWDSLVICLMIFFAGQMSVVKERFRYALESKDDGDQKRSLVNIYKHYVSLIEMQALCEELTSGVMFLYLLLISANFAVIIAEISSYTGTRFWSAAQYMCGLLMQLCFFYWHGNEVTVRSYELNYGLFESSWVDKGPHVRRLVLLMSTLTNKLLIFTAGPFNNLSLATFVAILRAAYSFYTLMKETTK